MSPSTLFLDADVLIDYAKSAPEVLSLVSRFLGPAVVIPQVLKEVHQLDAQACAELGIKLILPTPEEVSRTDAPQSGISAADQLSVVVCKQRTWTCVTNDRGIHRLCHQEGIPVRFGLSLLVDLVRVGAVSRARTEAVVRTIQAANPFHINEDVVNRVLRKLR